MSTALFALVFSHTCTPPHQLLQLTTSAAAAAAVARVARATGANRTSRTDAAAAEFLVHFLPSAKAKRFGAFFPSPSQMNKNRISPPFVVVPVHVGFWFTLFLPLAQPPIEIS